MAENGGMPQKPIPLAAREQERRELNRRASDRVHRARRGALAVARLGRPLTADELRRVLDRYPGDPPAG